MAAMDFIDTARLDLEEVMLALTSLIKMADQLAPNDSPEWLFVVGNHVMAVEKKAVAYMDAVHQHARPILNDFSQINKKV